MRRQRREDPKRELTKAQRAAQREAKSMAAEFDVAPADRAKIEAYHNDRVAELEAQGPNESSDDILDVKAESLARRERNAALQEAAWATEDEAKADWRARVGSRQESGLGWNEYRREVAARDIALEPNPEEDAMAREAFEEMVTSGTAPWLAPHKPYDSLVGHGNARADRKDASASFNANGFKEEPITDGEPVALEIAEPSAAEKEGRKVRTTRHERASRPSIARGNGGGNQR